MKVLITGATGFIGSHLTKVFHRNHDVTVLVRKNSRRDFISRYPIKFLEGDLRDENFLAESLRGFDLLIHAGAKVSDWGEYQDFFETNVLGSLRLIEALPDRTRMIYVSSNAVLGEEDCSQAKDEDEPYKPVCPYFLESFLPSGMNHYRLSKTIAEQMILHKAEIKKIDLTVIRPVWVFGPLEFHAGPYEYCKTLLSGIPVMPGSSKNRFHCIFVEDLAKLVLCVAEKQRQGIFVYNAGNPEIPLMEEYWELFSKALGTSKPHIFHPFLLYPLAIFLEIIWTLFKAKKPPLFTRARLYMFHANNVYSVEKIRSDFGFEAFTPFSRAVRKTVRWWRMNKFLT